MPSSDPKTRVLIARLAANERWGRTADRTAATAPGRKGFRAKLAREIDPDGTLPPDELERRVDQLHRAHMQRLSLLAKNAREARRKASQEGED